MIRRNVALALMSLAAVGCKPRAEGQGSSVKDAELVDFATMTSYVVYKQGDKYEIRGCPRGATPGTAADAEAEKRYMDACEARRGDGGNSLTRLECNLPTPFQPIPAAKYENGLQAQFGALGSETVDAALAKNQRDFAATSQTVASWEQTLNEMSPEDKAAVTPEFEKAKRQLADIGLAKKALELEVQRLKDSVDRYKTVLAMLDCGTNVRKVYPTQDYLTLIKPFVQGVYTPTEIQVPVNKAMREGQPFAQSVTFDVGDDFVVGDVDLSVDVTHKYPSEVGVRLTAPSGQTMELPLNIRVQRSTAVIGYGPSVVSFGEPVKSPFLGARSKGKWKIDFGDRETDTGTAGTFKITFYPVPVGDKRQDGRAYSAATRLDYGIPDKSTLRIPVFMFSSANVSTINASITFTHSSPNDITNAAVVDPSGKAHAMRRSDTGNAFVLSEGVAGNTIPVAGTWWFAISDTAASDTGNVTSYLLDINGPSGANTPGSSPTSPTTPTN